MKRLMMTVATLGLLTGPAAAEDSYGVLMKTLSNPFWGAMELGVREGAATSGVAVTVQAVESDQAAEPQLNTCNAMLERPMQGFITAAINSTILLPCLKRANEMGIPVVDLDGNLDHQIAADAGVRARFRTRRRFARGACAALGRATRGFTCSRGCASRTAACARSLRFRSVTPPCDSRRCASRSPRERTAR